MAIPGKNDYQNVIDFIDVAVDSDDLMNWLIDLEKLPHNLRTDHLARMSSQMVENNEPDNIINIVKSINNPEILTAVNLVIQDVYVSGFRTKKYLKKISNDKYNVLMSLFAAT